MSPEFLEELAKECPDPSRVAAIQKTFASSARAVHPLPSDRVLVLLCWAGFVLFALLIAAAVGLQGFHAFSVIQKLVPYTIYVVASLLLAVAVVEQMVPGSRRRVPWAVAVLFPLAALAVAVPLLFPDVQMSRFVERGIPCLRFGAICAIFGAALVWAFMRRGYLTDPIRAALAAATLSGLLGVGVLSLHCSIDNAAHILTWHLGVIGLALVGGLVSGWSLRKGSGVR